MRIATSPRALTPYGGVVMVLSIALRIKRTLDAAEIDKIIWDVEARKALALSIGAGPSGATPRWRPSAFGRDVNASTSCNCHHVHEIACSNRRIGRGRRMYPCLMIERPRSASRAGAVLVGYGLWLPLMTQTET
ncbi:hypothetical protein IVB36_21555 [Bradyrhizobium sp. 35]|uniref:hypothetical protein n=1 Tax=Bradyrhizobium sp. 35 TaxID=2782670 RepID=UPI001FF8DC3D|nr:hypothetical protein [Bradyrhizobium sp. 35]MCK1453393.1 hypothetical protein [Bradyrhizobium sp. 35]